MKHFTTSLKILLSLFALLMLNGCQHFMPGKMSSCEKNCVAEHHYCKKICLDSCSDCCGLSKIHAAQSYRRYVKQNRFQGFSPINLLQYYDDPLKCKKTSCDCQADYELCTQHCAGIIKKKLNSKKSC